MESQKLTSLLWAWLLNQATEVAENQNFSIEGQESRCYINLPSLLPYSNIKHYLWLWQWLFSWFDMSPYILYLCTHLETCYLLYIHRNARFCSSSELMWMRKINTDVPLCITLWRTLAPPSCFFCWW